PSLRQPPAQRRRGAAPRRQHRGHRRAQRRTDYPALQRSRPGHTARKACDDLRLRRQYEARRQRHRSLPQPVDRRGARWNVRIRRKRQSRGNLSAESAARWGYLVTRPRPTVLVVDDDSASRTGLASLLERWGYKSMTAPDAQAALKTCEQSPPDAMVLDLIMPGMTGLELVQALGDKVQQMAVIMLTGQAIKLGAYDYLAKPLEANRLRTALEKGLRQVELAREANALRQRLESPLGSYGSLIGKSPPMRELYQNISRVAATDAPVLVSGESGTGKELVARTLHDLSPRRDGPFLALN